MRCLKSTKNWKGRGARNNGEIIAYTIGDKQDTDFVLDTFDQLPQTTDCLLHSDQGSVYTSFDYQNQIKTKGITMSMSRKGTPSDNACIESFHASLKSETFYLDGLTNEPTSIKSLLLVKTQPPKIMIKTTYLVGGIGRNSL